ncbi:hypothetical protein GC176_28065 [bacterium]|nr:hypothetical protein [bacterium]
MSETLASLRESLGNLPFLIARMFAEEEIQQYAKAYAKHTIEAALTESWTSTVCGTHSGRTSRKPASVRKLLRN